MRYADLPAHEQNSDADLIEMFITHVPTNRKLLIGAAFLVNHANKTVGFDGAPVISDEGVKSTHRVMYNYFNAGEFEMDDHSSADGGGLMSAIQEGTKLAGNVLQNQHNKKFGSQDLLLKQQNAKIDIAKATADQRKQQQVAKTKEKTEKEKTKRMYIIGGSIALGAILLVASYFLLRKKK